MNKVAFPYIGDYYIPAGYFVKNALKSEVVIPPKITKKTIELGFKNSPNYVCTPFKYTIGTLIEAYEKGANTFLQLGGGCRYGYYGEVQEKILKDLGFDCKLINLISGEKLNIFKIYKILKRNFKDISFSSFLYHGLISIKMVIYMDIIDEYIRENIAFEVEAGSFESLKQIMLLDFEKTKNLYDLKKKFKYYREKFKQLKIRIPKEENYYKVGIIGELYTIMEPSANYYLERELAKNKIRIKRFTNATYLLLEKKRFVKKYIKLVNLKYNMGADATDNIIRTKYLCEEDYDGIIHIKSAFCTPEIAAMQIISKVADSYNVPVLFFSFDANTIETGIKTRLEAFYDMLEMRKRK